MSAGEEPGAGSASRRFGQRGPSGKSSPGQPGLGGAPWGLSAGPEATSLSPSDSGSQRPTQPGSAPDGVPPSQCWQDADRTEAQTEAGHGCDHTEPRGPQTQMTPTAPRAGTPQTRPPGWGPQPLTDAAVGTRKARRTLAAEPVDAIHADATIVAAGERARVRGPRAGQPLSRPTTRGRVPGAGQPTTATHQGRGLQSWVSVVEERGDGEPGISHLGTCPCWVRGTPGGGEGRQTPCCLHQPTAPRLEAAGPGPLWEDSPSWRSAQRVGCVRTVAGGRQARASTGGRKLGEVRGLQLGFRSQAQGVGQWGRVGGGQDQEAGDRVGPRQPMPTAPPWWHPPPQAHCGCRCGPPSRHGRCRRRSPHCPRRCPRSRRGWAGSCCSWLQRGQR